MSGGLLYVKSGIENSQNYGTVLFERPKQISAIDNSKVFIYYNPSPSGVLHKYHAPQSYLEYVEPANAVISYMLVNNARDLQDINFFLHGNYALS